jgi:hypothetical protein
MLFDLLGSREVLVLEGSSSGASFPPLIRVRRSRYTQNFGGNDTTTGAPVDALRERAAVS